jgi:hypothetical protein
MNHRLIFRPFFVFVLILETAALIGSGHVAEAADHSKGPTNEFGVPVRNDQGAAVNYSRDQLAAIAAKTLPPGQYTAWVQGKNGASGVGVVQAYFLE